MTKVCCVTTKNYVMNYASYIKQYNDIMSFPPQNLCSVARKGCNRVELKKLLPALKLC